MQSSAILHVGVGPVSGEEYFEALTTVIAIVGSVCIFGVLAAMEVAAGLADEGSVVDKFGLACFLIGPFGLVVSSHFSLFRSHGWALLFLSISR